MTNQGALALTTFLNFANRVFSITIPGTNWSFRAFFLSIICTCFVIGVIRHFFENGISIKADSFINKGESEKGVVTSRSYGTKLQGSNSDSLSSHLK